MSNIAIYRGLTTVIAVTITDPSTGLAVDLTGAILTLTARYAPTDTSAALSLTIANGGIVVTDAANGKAELVFAPSLTSSWPNVAQSLAYDLLFTSAGGETDGPPAQSGTLTVVPVVGTGP